MKVPRPRFETYEPGDAPGPAWDTVEPKYDGMWATCVVRDGGLKIYSRTGRLRDSWTVDPGVDAVLLAEFLVGTSWAKGNAEHRHLIVFDCLKVDGRDVGGEPLHRRRELAARVVQKLARRDVHTVEQHAADGWRQLWDDLVERDGFEGLAFKSSAAPYGAAWGRMKASVDADYVCIGVHRNAAGRPVSLAYGLYFGRTLCPVGTVRNGVAPWDLARAGRLVGQVMLVTGQAIGASGAMRHPVFVGWREDKVARECVARL